MKVCLHNGTILNGISQMENCAVYFDGDTITDVFSEKRFEEKKFDSDTQIIDVHGSFIAPGLIDTHIHGFMGHGTDKCSTDGILSMARDLAQYGVTAFNPTIYPAPEEEMLKTIRQIVAAKKEQEHCHNKEGKSVARAVCGAHIMGIHLEGPFISPEKLGVQRPETVKPVDLDLMDRLWEASEGTIVNMTVAPELKHMRHLALNCIQKGIVLQAGHTNARYENMVEGMQAGILHTTHFFNAMSQMHHRDPGAVGAVLIHNEMTCEIIADGKHVHPDLFKLLIKDKTPDNIILITDALTPTEQKNGPLFANGEEVLFKDGCFHRKEDDVIAGSALTMIQGVKNLINFGMNRSEAIKCATVNPAKIMNYRKKGLLIPGYDSDIIVFDNNFNLQITAISGNLVKRI
ncbi:MAG: N-acetylglucosamine-6-phosphate deacetylase [Treponema sp. CETP13]|nr:MAG: N-acetylglucosamine-6-phosphate deacetylase [Treponema sp. CETP13]